MILVLLRCFVLILTFNGSTNIPKNRTHSKLAPLLRTAISSRFGANIYSNVRRSVRRQLPEIYKALLYSDEWSFRQLPVLFSLFLPMTHIHIHLQMPSTYTQKRAKGCFRKIMLRRSLKYLQLNFAVVIRNILATLVIWMWISEIFWGHKWAHWKTQIIVDLRFRFHGG